MTESMSDREGGHCPPDTGSSQVWSDDKQGRGTRQKVVEGAEGVKWHPGKVDGW